ncbi:MAG TPA: glycosyltransferase family 4 protein [Acidobacteriota bacterium]|nr:glycosyltransferase family 4 protein [Acidobacteriota bacterium]
MKILYAATDQDLASIHGGSIHVFAVTAELIHHGHEVHLVVQESSKPVQVPDGSFIHELRPTHRFMLWNAGPEIQNVLERLHPDIVIERYYNFAGEAILRSKKLEIPSVLEVNSPMIEYPGSFKSKVDFLLGQALEKRRNRIAEAATLIISPMTQIIPGQYQSKVRQIEWGADTNLFNPASLPDRSSVRIQLGWKQDELIFLHFGSLRKWHGLTKLLEAYDAARTQIQKPNRLVVIGPMSDGPQRKGVHFAGLVAHPKMPAWLKASDVAVFPFDIQSHRYLELGFYWSPLKLFEAMSMELPILTLNHPRLISLLGTEDPDFLYDGSMENLAAQLVHCATNISSMNQKAKSFRERIVKNYSWQIHGTKLNELLLEVVHR